ncbi:MAG: hypothetical protein FJ288_01845 [Planctomycetes bacterium]|nr:hypothetical protein [Planctomycetota bacterium]
MMRCVGMGVAACAVLLLGLGQVQATTTLYLTTRDTSPVTLAGVTFERGDIVAYKMESGTASLFFTGKDYFRKSDGTTGAAANIDGLYVYADGRILLSTDGTARLGATPLKFENGDIVLFDMASDTASIFLAGSGSSSIFRASGGARGAAANVDAIHLMDNGHLLLSTTSQEKLGTNLLVIRAGSIVEYDPVNDHASIYFASTLFRTSAGAFVGPDAINVDGVSMFGGSLLLSTNDDPARLGAPPDMLTFHDGDVVMYDRATDEAKIFFSQDLLQCNAKDIDGLSVLTWGQSQEAVIPEPVTPVTACGLVLGALGLAGYLRRRTARA